jgi:hypothetical protein
LKTPRKSRRNITPKKQLILDLIAAKPGITTIEIDRETTIVRHQVHAMLTELKVVWRKIHEEPAMLGSHRTSRWFLTENFFPVSKADDTVTVVR